MVQFSIWPYEECQFSLEHRDNILRIQTPWLKSAFRVKKDDHILYEQVIKLVKSRPNVKSIELVKDILGIFNKYPYFYYLPRLDLPKDSELGIVNWPLPPRMHPWDKVAALQLSKISPDLYDPVTLMTIMRRYLLLEFKGKNNRETLLTLVNRSNDFPKNKLVLGKLLAQDVYLKHFFIQHMQFFKSLHNKCHQQINEFIQELHKEINLSEKILKLVGVNKDQHEPSEHIKELMANSINIKNIDILQFCFLLDALENSVFLNFHQLLDLLEEKGFGPLVRPLKVEESVAKPNFHNFSIKILARLGSVHESAAKRFVDRSYQMSLVLAEILEERYNLAKTILR